MFVSKKRYQELESKFLRLLIKWDTLVDEINSKGGQVFLDHAKLNAPSQFSQSEINQLIRLCHPDKHDNSVIATEMTKKLLAMRQ